MVFNNNMMHASSEFISSEDMDMAFKNNMMHASSGFIVRLKKMDHLNFDFTKTLPTASILIAQQRAMAYSKACFLTYKMRYHLNLKLLT